MRVLFVGLLALFLSVAQARTIAVLPLEQGASSEVYAGLGIALSGMLITDLSQVEGIAVVERSQLDALLAEVELGKSGYVDPKTAARIGKGLGAQWLVLGSWSVVAPQFLLDIRVVDVDTGLVLGSAAASGSVDDFVSVEKDAVEALLTTLKVDVSGSTRRKILAEAPTESFEAMKAYAAGLKAEQDKDYEAAREFYETSTRTDPNFTAPSLRASKLLAQIQRTREDHRQQQNDARQAEIEKALAKTPDELSLKKPSKLDELALLRVRWALLAYQKKPCQLAEEIRHALERHEGKFQRDEAGWQRLHNAVYDLGLADERPYLQSNGVVSTPNGFFNEVMRSHSLWGSPTSLIIEITDGVDEAPRLRRGLANLTIQCAGPGDQPRVDALVELRQLIRKLGLEDERAQKGGTTIGEELEVLELDARVRIEGMSARVEKRLQALLAGQDPYSSLQADARMVIDHAAKVERHKRLRQDLDYARVQAWIAGARANQPPIDLSSPACAPLVGKKWYDGRLDEALEDGFVTAKEYSYTVNALVIGHLLRRLGCVTGEPGDLTTTAQALAWLDTFPSRFLEGADPEKCAQPHAELVERLRHTRTPRPDAPEYWAHRIVESGLVLVRNDCALR